MNYIDLGLPSGTLWADRNVGAENPQDCGDYFNFEDAQKCGSLPARWQMCELVDECEREVITMESGVKGMKLIGKNGNSIFMPFTGYMFDFDGSPRNVGYGGFWWSCTPSDCNVYYLYLLSNGNFYPSDYCCRAYNQSVRLIKNKE